MYDPTVGRFLSEDPIGEDVNLYRYCHNSPTNRVDPTGLVDWSLWPNWLERDTSIETIDRMIKTAKGQRLSELRTAKKILQHGAGRLAGKGPGIRPPTGGGMLAPSPLSPLIMGIDIGIRSWWNGITPHEQMRRDRLKEIPPGDFRFNPLKGGLEGTTPQGDPVDVASYDLKKPATSVSVSFGSLRVLENSDGELVEEMSATIAATEPIRCVGEENPLRDILNR
jgi:hypothetical protein